MLNPEEVDSVRYQISTEKFPAVYSLEEPGPSGRRSRAQDVKQILIICLNENQANSLESEYILLSWNSFLSAVILIATLLLVNASLYFFARSRRIKSFFFRVWCKMTGF